MKKLTVLLFAAAWLFSSCITDDDKDSNGGSYTAAGLAGNWKLTAATVTPPITFMGTTYSDMYASMENCEKDDVITLNADGTWTEANNEICDPTDPDETDGNGTFSVSGNTMTITETGEETQTATVSSATKITITEVIPAGFFDDQEHTMTMTMTKQ